jgi:hypothetical protein
VRSKRDYPRFILHNHFADAAGRLLNLLVLIFLCSFPTAIAYEERLILAMPAGDCTLRVEAEEESRSIRLRILPEGSNCYFTKEAMQSLLKRAFSKSDSPKLEGTYSSLFLGRLIDYPWLSAYVASAAYEDSRWNKRRGMPVSMGINKYVATLLLGKEVTVQVEEPIMDTGYRITSASVEKVLVGGLRDIPQYKGKLKPGKVPFDALVWFHLEKK